METLIARVHDLIEDGDLPAALSLLDAHLLHQHDDDALRLRARLRLREPGQENAALDDLNALQAPADEDHLMRAHLHRQLGENGAALAALDQLPDTWNVQHMRGDLLVTLDAAAAIKAYTRALEGLAALGADPLLDVERAALLVKRADARESLGAHDDALSDYSAAERHAPHDLSIPFARGLLLLTHSGLRAALPVCRDALDRAAPNTRVKLENRLREQPRYAPLLHALLSD